MSTINYISRRVEAVRFLISEARANGGLLGHITDAERSVLAELETDDVKGDDEDRRDAEEDRTHPCIFL